MNNNINYWIEEGHKIIDRKYWEDWDEHVPSSVNGTYGGHELGDCLEIIKALNEGCDIAYAVKLMEKQNHSGCGWKLVRILVRYFCDRGEEFANATE